MSKWLQSGRVRTLFLYSSWVVVCMGIFVTFMLTPWFRQIDALPNGDIALRLLGGALGVVGALASIILWIGMAIFCLCEDRSAVGYKIWWFLLFFATASFGSAAYFFKSYRKQVVGGATVAVLP